jgi:hypothetical protein
MWKALPSVLDHRVLALDSSRSKSVEAGVEMLIPSGTVSGLLWRAVGREGDFHGLSTPVVEIMEPPAGDGRSQRVP